MKLWHKKSEAERVESTRKLVNRSKWLGLIHIFFCIFFIITCVIGVHFFSSLKKDLFPEINEPINQAIHIGITLGAFVVFQFLLALMCMGWAVEAFFGHGLEKMMLKYHDKLTEKENNFQSSGDDVDPARRGTPSQGASVPKK